MMELDERKKQVLHAVIKKYILTGEPVGSRTISKDSNLGVSSATIRNEMSDLEDMGYLVQPHTSAGRIPADKGYRLYVNQILPYIEDNSFQRNSSLINLVSGEINHLEVLLQEAIKVLSRTTSYTAIVISPENTSPKIKKVQLILIDREKIMVLLISNTKVIQSDIFTLNEEITEDEINLINNFLNIKLQGKKFNEVEENIVEEEMSRVGKNSLANKLVPAILNTVNNQQKKDIYFEGVTNALDYLDFDDITKAKEFLEFVDDKNRIANLLNDGMGMDSDIEFTIGSENKDEEMKELTVVKSVYRAGGETVGKIGLVGPTRMDYQKVMYIIKALTEDLNRIIKTYLLK
ncbi:MAG: heat-inducible transcriptional repressor HrcA [Andreesenia angusta]|nr:heat-inducible transcriptional repressor HrcA [Andreesenia angusta]